MAEIRGKVTDNNDDPVEGVKITLINDSQDSLAGTTTTDSNGEYSFNNLSASDTYHVAAQYDDGSDYYNAYSKPFIGAVDAAYFDIVIISTNSPVEETETLEVDYTVENIGNASGTQDITLEINGNQVDADRGISLNAGESLDATLLWDTSSGDEGDYTAKVSSDDDPDTESVTVGSQTATYEVNIDDTNSPVNQGDTAEATVTVENTGLAEDQKDVWLEIDGTEEDRYPDLYIQGEDRAVIYLQWDTDSDEAAGDYTATVKSPDDSDTATITVQEPIGTGDVFVSQTSGVHYSLNDSDGSRIWKTGISNMGQNAGAVDSDNFYVPDRDSAEAGVTALDKADGSVFWSSAADFACDSGVALRDGVLYAGAQSGRVYAIDESDGSIKWTKDTGGNIQAPPMPLDSDVYVGSHDGFVYALDPANGDVNWKKELTGKPKTPVYDDGSLYVVREEKADVTRMSASGGSVNWQTSLSGSSIQGVFPAVTGSAVFAGTIGTTLVKLNKDDGSKDFSFGSGGTYADPTVYDRYVYIPSADGSLYSIARADGLKNWENSSPGFAYPASAPAHVDGNIYVGEDNGNLKAFKESDGSLIWEGETDNNGVNAEVVGYNTGHCKSNRIGITGNTIPL